MKCGSGLSGDRADTHRDGFRSEDSRDRVGFHWSAVSVRDPVDAHVGARLRQARLVAQLSQDELGLALGVSGEQIGRYECGMERVGAGRLYLACKRLSVPPTYFFEGFEAPVPEEVSAPVSEGGASELGDRASRLAVDRLIEKILARIKDERSGV